MSIRTPEIAAQFGAIDSDAAEDGAPFSAHLLRTIARNSNRLVSRGHMLCNVVWPMAGNRNNEGSELWGQEARGRLYSEWVQITQEVPVQKKPGLTSCSARITATVSGTQRASFRLCTQATGLQTSPGNGNVVDCTGIGSSGPGSNQVLAIDDVPCSSGPDEVVSLWARATSQTTPTLGDTSVYGYPNLGAQGTDTDVTASHIQEARSAHTVNPIWNNSNAANNFADSNHQVWFRDNQGGLLGWPRHIASISVLSATSDAFLYFDPFLTVAELQAVHNGGTFEIRTQSAAADVELWGLAVAADDRLL